MIKHMNSLTIRKSRNPEKKNSYAIFFYDDNNQIAKYTTPNGSFLEVGRVIDAWCNHDMLPRLSEKVELVKAEKG